jgi:hypothetical protein
MKIQARKKDRKMMCRISTKERTKAKIMKNKGKIKETNRNKYNTEKERL